MNKHEKALWLRARMAKAQATQGATGTSAAPTSHTRADTACRTQELEWEDDGGCEHQRTGVTYEWTITENSLAEKVVFQLPSNNNAANNLAAFSQSGVSSRIKETDNAKDSAVLASSSPYRTSRYSLEEVRDRLVALRQASAVKWKLQPHEICNDEQLERQQKPYGALVSCVIKTTHFFITHRR